MRFIVAVGSMDNILYAEGLPEHLDDASIQAMFPEASMVAVPRKNNTFQG